MADPHQQKPTILLLSLDYDTTDDWSDEPEEITFREAKEMLVGRAQVKRATSLEGALKYLNDNRPDGILVGDCDIMEHCNAQLLGRITAFAQYGGTVVFGFHFPSTYKQYGEESSIEEIL
ncbi:hypothetical protein PG984_003522 [Apiospora sp. TS-2023a]